MESVKKTLINTINQLPTEIFVGLMIFNQNVMLASFEGDQVEYVCFNGSENYTTAQQVYDIMGYNISKGMNVGKTFLNRHFVPLKTKI